MGRACCRGNSPAESGDKALTPDEIGELDLVQKVLKRAYTRIGDSDVRLILLDATVRVQQILFDYQFKETPGAD